ncbi:MAG: multicopper oxidase domain-containing protein [bacterium]
MRAHPIALLLALAGSSATHGTTRVYPGSRAVTPARISINDNRSPAGVLRGNVLTLRLVARVGMWHPDGDSATGAPTEAFAEEGRASFIPGPLIRVRAGTEVIVTLRNDIPATTLVVHGLVSRSATTPTAKDSVQLRFGATTTVRARLDAPGTYYYWGSTTGRALGDRVGVDAQLTGAIVVDPADAPKPTDRVLVLGMWADTMGRVNMVRKRVLTVINGRSWPRTERFSAVVGDTMSWRLINATADMHPMHLHGFYYRVDSRGDGDIDSIYAKDARDKVVTDLMKPGTTMRMTWSPDRPGNWLFHCHLPEHFGRRGPLGTVAIRSTAHEHGAMNHALDGMSGLVMGITVRPRAGRITPASSVGGVSRQVRLVIRASGRDSAIAPDFEFALNDGHQPLPSSAAERGPAPPIVLTRGEPVSITVVNTLTEPTAIHWHGIELESYYDGVAGFSGDAQRVSPVIAPGDSFVARFTPPRAGTFIYHSHVDEERQQPAGLAGPIIVLEKGATYDPLTDISIVASSQPTRIDPTGRIGYVVLLNGRVQPTPLNLVAGVRYRLRFINMSTGFPGLRFDLSQDGALMHWRPLAKDGAELPLERQVMRASRQNVSIGETADVELIPERAGDQRLTAHLSVGTLLGTLVVHVSPSETRAP